MGNNTFWLYQYKMGLIPEFSHPSQIENRKNPLNRSDSLTDRKQCKITNGDQDITNDRLSTVHVAVNRISRRFIFS